MKRVPFVLVFAAAALLAPAVAPGAKHVKVAYITDVPATPGPRDLRGLALLGFQRAVKDFGVDGRVVVFEPREGPVPTLTLLARQRYDLVLIGEVREILDDDRIAAVARRFPSTRFVLTDPPWLQPWPKNVQGSIWRVEQPAYLAGFLSALLERQRPGRDVVGSVDGFPIVSVTGFIAGFEAGARAADPGIRILRRYSQDFFNTTKCRSIALSEIAAGAGALFNVAGHCGLGAIAAAKAKGVWAIGVDVDQSFLGPQVLTSVLKRFDVQAYDTVEAFVRGKLRTGGNSVWDLHNDAVGLGKISPKVPRDVLRELERVRAQIEAGRIRVPSTLGRR